MTDAGTAAAPIQTAAAATLAAPGRGPGTRAYLLAGCSVGATLCASLTSTSGVNLPFAILSALLGGVVVLLTAAPAAAPPQAVVAASSASGVITPTPVVYPTRRDSISTGVTAAVLAYVILQIQLFVFGGALGTLLAGVDGMPSVSALNDASAEYLVLIAIPVNLLLGAYLLAGSRSLLLALTVFALTYFACFLLEQAITIITGFSPLFEGMASGAPELAAAALVTYLLPPFFAQAIAAIGSRLAGRLLRPALT